jgi:hypothetical protein
MKKYPLIACLLLLIGIYPTASKAHESEWQRRYCEGMELEKHLPSGGRVDCLIPQLLVAEKDIVFWVRNELSVYCRNESFYLCPISIAASLQRQGLRCRGCHKVSSEWRQCDRKGVGARSDVQRLHPDHDGRPSGGAGQSSAKMVFDAEPPDDRVWLFGNAWRIFADGEIDESAPERLQTLIESLKIPDNSYVYFNSPGGNLAAGIELGRVIRKYGLNTNVAAKDERATAACMSACTLAFLGGKFRFVGSKAYYGVHRFFFTTRGTDDVGAAQVISALVTNYIREMGVDPNLFYEMTKAGPSDVNLLSKPALESLGVTNNGFTKTVWSLEALDIGLYLKGERDTIYGINKLIFYCPKNQLAMHVIFDAQLRDEEILAMETQTLSIDQQLIPLEDRLVSKTSENGWINAIFAIERGLIPKFLSASEIGIHFQHFRGSPFFLGFQQMDFSNAHQKFRGLLSVCGLR